MAQLKIKNSVRHKLKGFVLIESVFAMIITMICFGIAISTVNNLLASNSTALRTEAKIAVHEFISQTDQYHLPTDTIRHYGSFTIQRTVSESESANGILIISFEIRNRQDKILDVYRIMRTMPNET
jgi:competence protein ComGC